MTTTSLSRNPFTGNPYDASRLSKRFYKAMEAAGMADRCGRNGGITFHSLRHTFRARMAAVGVPMRTLQESMGRDYTTTLVYADSACPVGRAPRMRRRRSGDIPRDVLSSAGRRVAGLMESAE